MIEVSLVEIVVATFSGMVLGALWYSPILFGAAWMNAIGKTAETLGSQTLPMIGSVMACSLTAVGIAILFSVIQVSSLLGALGIGLLLAVGIVFPALLSDNLFCGWGGKLLIIQAGYRMINVLLMSLVVFVL